MHIDYDKFISIIADINRLIDSVDDGYLWRELSGIELNLRQSINKSEEEILNDINSKMY